MLCYTCIEVYPTEVVNLSISSLNFFFYFLIFYFGHCISEKFEWLYTWGNFLPPSLWVSHCYALVPFCIEKDYYLYDKLCDCEVFFFTSHMTVTFYSESLVVSLAHVWWITLFEKLDSN